MATIITYSWRCLQLMDVLCRLTVHYTVNTIKLHTCVLVYHSCIIRKHTNMLSLVSNKVLPAYTFSEALN